MSSGRKRIINTVVCAAMLPAQAFAQTAINGAAQLAAPEASSVQQTSSFADYRPYQDPQVGDWRKHNEAIGTLGGHMGHLQNNESPPQSSNKTEHRYAH